MAQNPAPAPPCSFARVMHAKGEVLLINIDCGCLHLMTYIRDQCAPDADILSLELCTERGRLSGAHTAAMHSIIYAPHRHHQRRRCDGALHRQDRGVPQAAHHIHPCPGAPTAALL